MRWTRPTSRSPQGATRRRGRLVPIACWTSRTSVRTAWPRIRRGRRRPSRPGTRSSNSTRCSSYRGTQESIDHYQYGALDKVGWALSQALDRRVERPDRADQSGAAPCSNQSCPRNQRCAVAPRRSWKSCRNRKVQVSRLRPIIKAPRSSPWSIRRARSITNFLLPVPSFFLSRQRRRMYTAPLPLRGKIPHREVSCEYSDAH